MGWVVELRRAEVACPVEHEGAYRRAMRMIAEMLEGAYVDLDRSDSVAVRGIRVPGGVPDVCDSGPDERRDEGV